MNDDYTTTIEAEMAYKKLRAWCQKNNCEIIWQTPTIDGSILAKLQLPNGDLVKVEIENCELIGVARYGYNADGQDDITYSDITIETLDTLLTS